MSEVVDKPLKPSAPSGNALLLLGGTIGFVSAAGLAWDGRVCVDVLHDALMARDASGFVSVGQRLVRIGWCPLGVAIGGTLVSLGRRRAAGRNGLSLACVGLVALYGLFAALGAFAVWQGAGGARAKFFLIATSDAVIKPEEIVLATAESVEPLSRGWMLLAVAHVTLLAGAFSQIVFRSGSASPSAHWPKTATVALILLWLFGAIVSISWIRDGLAFQQYGAGPLKAADVAEQIGSVISSGWHGGRLLMGHALLTMVVAVSAVIHSAKRSGGQP